MKRRTVQQVALDIPFSYTIAVFFCDTGNLHEEFLSDVMALINIFLLPFV